MNKEEMEEMISVIEEWRSAAEKENSYFAKYALEFFAFNSLVRLNFGDGGEQERTLIERCKGFFSCDNWRMDDKTKKAIRGLVKITKERQLKNLTRNKKIKIENEKDWNNIIEAVYVIRNNLFHGHKQYSRERDNELVEVGYPILKWLNKILIENLRSKYQEENA